MALKRTVFLAIAVFSIILISSGIVFSQEEMTTEEPAVEQTPAESQIQWLWGEVVSLDAQNNQIVVKYLDYENDAEKEITLTADEKTTYENVKSINEINPKDSVSIDYIISPDGKNTAKNISVEKIENRQDMQEENAAEGEKTSLPAIEEEPSQMPAN